MKKSILFITLIGITFGMNAQNTFPSSGNVGIGTTSPNYKIDIKSTVPVIQLKHTSDGVPAYGFLQFSDVNSRMGFIGFGSNQNSSLYLQNDTGGAVIIPSGNVGIGTTSPSFKLDIDSASPVIQLKHKSDGVAAYGFLQFSDVNSRMGFIGFGSSANNNLYIENGIGNIVMPNGNVGVGTIAPTAKLDVRGHIFGKNFLSVTSSQGGNALVGLSSSTQAYIIGNDYTGATKFFIDAAGKSYFNGGNVGIGTANPSYKLDVQGSLRSRNVSASNSQGNTVVFMGSGNYPNENGYINGRDTSLGVKFLVTANGNSYFNGGNVGIGTTTPSEKLTVNGKILSEEVEVILDVPGPDYVFEKYYTGTSALKADYVMPTLEEVEAFTKANKHLSDVPSAKILQEDGLELKNMSLLLLQKIEELTLYTIEQEKRIKALEARQ